MDAAEELVDKIHFLADLQKECAGEFILLAAELEQQRLGVNKTLVAGSVVSVVGSAALLTAAFCTGGTIVPLLAVTGKTASLLGLSINVGSEVVDAVTSEESKKEAKISEKLRRCEKEIQALMEELAMEAERLKVSREEYVTDRILRAMARRYGLKVDVNVSFLKLVANFVKSDLFLGTCFRLAGSFVYKLVLKFLPKTAPAGRKAISKVVKSSVASTASKQAMKAAGSKASGKALKYATRGALGILFSGSELIYNCATVSNCETESSKRFREMATELTTSSGNIKKELAALEKMCKELAEVRDSIGNSNRSSKEKQTLMEFALKHCKDNTVQKWLKENSESRAFFKLVDMFCFLHEEINKKRTKIDKENIDITFLAHGCIKESMIQASCLLPLPTIEDVILYSPWNCLLIADAAYAIATGRIEPQHRIFGCRKHKGCEIPDKDHQPTNLHNHWNSMKKAGAQKIPNIHVSPLTTDDGAWKRVVELQVQQGQPGRNRILVPYMLPGETGSSDTIPFYVVTLALSMVLHFSSLKATVHLAACLGRATTLSDQDYLDEQYCYTIDGTFMTSLLKMLNNNDLSGFFKALTHC
ncbi:uncharacterized protein LOC121503743 [Cheilinus undulatus]|uniref:uncharacterized protein LOC121503743 n=1 Tax=Cheilinus undulatus TaxID=241271 RepID=UPI001BD52DCB|nr:uncharacterized protein LOC121503743 [Cheilinus undulatus]